MKTGQRSVCACIKIRSDLHYRGEVKGRALKSLMVLGDN